MSLRLMGLSPPGLARSFYRRCVSHTLLWRRRLFRDVHHVASRERIWRTVNHPIRSQEALHNFDLSPKISSERHRFELDLVAKTHGGDLQSVLAEHKRARWNANDVAGIV